MKIFLFLLGNIFIFSCFSYSQSILQIQYSEFVNSVNYFANGAVYIETPIGNCGTGTFIDVPFVDKPDSGAMFVATTLHILAKKDKLNKTIGYFDTVFVSMQINNGSLETRRYHVLRKYENLDLSILEPIDKFRSFKEYKQTHASPEEIATRSDILPGQTAIMVGYPFTRGVSPSGLMPVVQNGIISFVDTIRHLVIIDIPVNYGNSGGPIYTWNIKGEAKLVGLVLAYESNPQDSVYSAVFKSNIPMNASLGKVVPLYPIINELKKLTIPIKK